MKESQLPKPKAGDRVTIVSPSKDAKSASKQDLGTIETVSTTPSGNTTARVKRDNGGHALVHCPDQRVVELVEELP